MTLKVIELFAGVGSQHMALKKLKIDFEVVAISEIDRFAIQSYEAIHGPVKNLGDITLIDPENVPDHDLLTYSFPCQDISNAGYQKGLDEDSETRSSLLWQCRKVIESKKPKFLLLENVKNLVGKRHKHNFDKWLNWLESQGYTNYWQVLNAKDYGIPQNRERVFVVSILDDTQSYEFPKPVELDVCLKDILELEVDEKFYLNNDKARILISRSNKPDAVIQDQSQMHRDGGKRGVKGYDIYSPAITAREYKDRRLVKVVQTPVIAASRGRNPENISDRTAGSPTEQRLEINEKGLSNTITTVQKDNYVLEPKVINPLKGKTDYGWHFEQAVYSSEGITRSVKAGGGSGNIPKVIEPSGIYTNDSPKFHRGPLSGVSRTLKAGKHDAGVIDGYRIRKLTPLECWRLMGFSDEDFYKSAAVCSNSQLYKQAGNSIVVNVLEAIFSQIDFDEIILFR